jgi:hypothetical protein
LPGAFCYCNFYYFSIYMKMLLFVLSFFLFLIIHSSFAQVYVGDSKKWLKIHVDQDFRNIKKTATKTETDSTYTFGLRGSFSPEDLYFKFDRSSTCYYQKWTFSCDTCYHKMLSIILNKKRYRWKRTAQNEYLSKTSKQLKLKEEIPGQAFTITQLCLREQDYQAMYDKAIDN